MVESICQCDSLEITWARFKYILSHYPILIKIKNGVPLDHGDMIQLQKDNDNGYKPDRAMDRNGETAHTFGGNGGNE
jgi:hypothetical protein